METQPLKQLRRANTLRNRMAGSHHVNTCSAMAIPGLNSVTSAFVMPFSSNKSLVALFVFCGGEAFGASSF